MRILRLIEKFNCESYKDGMNHEILDIEEKVTVSNIGVIF